MAFERRLAAEDDAADPQMIACNLCRAESSRALTVVVEIHIEMAVALILRPSAAHWRASISRRVIASQSNGAVGVCNSLWLCMRVLEVAIGSVPEPPIKLQAECSRLTQARKLLKRISYHAAYNRITEK